MRRVVITGSGIVSPIGSSMQEVAAALKAGTSGIEHSPEMAEHGFRSQIAGTLKIDPADHVDKRRLRFMGPGAAYAHIAMTQAIAEAGLSPDEVSHPMTGLIAGSGGPSTSAIFAAHQRSSRPGAPKRIGPFAVPKCMSSTISANLSTAFEIKGVNYSITSACSTSLHCIGNGRRTDHDGQAGRHVCRRRRGAGLDVVLPVRRDGRDVVEIQRHAGTGLRAFDADRDGFVIAGGGGIVVLEALDRALARGARSLPK